LAGYPDAQGHRARRPADTAVTSAGEPPRPSPCSSAGRSGGTKRQATETHGVGPPTISHTMRFEAIGRRCEMERFPHHRTQVPSEKDQTRVSVPPGGT